MSTREDETLYLINEALVVSFSGLLVCSLFLSLQLFEIFYCLAVMMNAILYITAKRFAASEPVPGRRTGNNWKVQRSRGVH